MKKVDLDVVCVNHYIVNHKKEFNKEIGKMIREWRVKRNISIDEMAAMTFMSTSYITQLENGVNGITLSKFITICNALEINLKEILEDYLYTKQSNEDILFAKLQDEKNLSENIIDFMKEKKSN